MANKIPDVPTSGPDSPSVLFVIASPNQLEVVRKCPLVGPPGETFRKQYLAPLGCHRTDVAITSLVPTLSDNISDDVREWATWFQKELDRLKPSVIVGLGRTVKSALGDLCDEVLPHPAAVRKYGNSGEIDRKIRRIKKRLEELHAHDYEENTVVAHKWGDEWYTVIDPAQPGEYIINDGTMWLENSGVVYLPILDINKNDSGKYKLGVIHKNKIEIFLDGREFSGKFILEGDCDLWSINRPEDQTPIVKKEDIADHISDAKKSDTEYLFWGSPEVYTQKIHVPSGKIERSYTVPIAKAHAVKQIVAGCVLDPYQFDAEGDWISPAQIEDTAHKYLIESRVIGYEHREKANGVPVESWIVHYPSDEDYRKALAGEPHRAYQMKYGRDIVHSGAWILATKLADEEWQKYLDGEIDAYSIGGFGHRTPISRDAMPEVEFIDLVPA
jgi:uracil-DNA glycosylase family 4